LETVELNNIIIAKEEFNNKWIIGEIDQVGLSFKWKKYIPEDILSEIWQESPYKIFFSRLQRALTVLNIEDE